MLLNRKCFFALWVTSSCVACVVHGQLIELTPKAMEFGRVEAHDADFSPPGVSSIQDEIPVALPFRATGDAIDGGSNSQSTFDLTDSHLAIGMNQRRAGGQSSLARSFGSLAFTPMVNLHYEISGTFDLSGALFDALDAAYVADNGHPVFGVARENTAAVNASAQLALGSGAPEGANANSVGSMFAGDPYTLRYEFRIAANKTDGGSSATGKLDLRLALRGDLNDDRAVGFDDLLVVAQNYGEPGRVYATGDINGDGTVGFEDLLLLAQQYGISVPPAGDLAAVPEPSAVTTAAVLAFCLRRKRKGVAK